MMTDHRSSLSRRDFLRLACLATAGAVLAGCQDKGALPVADDNRSVLSPEATATPAVEENASGPAPVPGDVYLAVAHGADPQAITQAAIAALGGIERFVKSGADVVIKPNICTDYHPPEYATTTNPVVVATLVSLCLGAGAKRVRVMDNPFGGTAKSAYAISGIAEAVEAAGGEMHVMSPVV
jgi:hypothetical protein